MGVAGFSIHSVHKHTFARAAARLTSPVSTHDNQDHSRNSIVSSDQNGYLAWKKRANLSNKGFSLSRARSKNEQRPIHIFSYNSKPLLFTLRTVEMVAQGGKRPTQVVNRRRLKKIPAHLYIRLFSAPKKNRPFATLHGEHLKKKSCRRKRKCSQPPLRIMIAL